MTHEEVVTRVSEALRDHGGPDIERVVGVRTDPPTLALHVRDGGLWFLSVGDGVNAATGGTHIVEGERTT